MMQIFRVLQPAACSIGSGLLAEARSSYLCTSGMVGRHAGLVWQRQRCRFLSSAASPSVARSPDAGESNSIRPWEKPLIGEVYRQLRGQHIKAHTSHTSAGTAGAATLGSAIHTSIPGWEFTPEDERGLRFGSAYMLLTLAWNRKFTRVRDLLINANRAREGSKQVITRILSVIASDLSPASKVQAASEPSIEGCSTEGDKDKDAFPEKAESGGCSNSSYHDVPEHFITGLNGCLSTQLQQLLQHQVAFLAQRGLSLHTVIRPQRVVVDSVYGIVGCTRGSSATSTVLLQHRSLQVLLRRGSNSSSLGAPATMYMAKRRPFDFEGAVALAEAANNTSSFRKPSVKQTEAESDTKGDAVEHVEDADPASSDETLSALDRRQQHMVTETLWRKRAREQMQEILRQPLTFRQFMNMCADCGSVLDRGFVVVVDFKLLCSQQLAILDSDGNAVVGSKDDELAVHTLRLELNAKFDANNSNFIFPAFEPSSWQLMDWNYAIGPQYPVDPRDISNVVILDEDKGAPNNAVACFV